MADDAAVTTASESSATSSRPAAGTTRTGRPAAGRPAGGRQTNDKNLRKRLEIAFFVTPALAMLVLFVVWPVITAVQMSVYRWNGRGPMVDFVGLANYVSVLTDDVFVGSLVNNLVIVVASIAIQLPLGLAIALLLNRKMWGQGMLRTIIFVPYVLAEVVAGVIWFQLLQPYYGVLDTLLQAVGLEPPPQGWLGDPDLALWTVLVILTWKYLGLAVILFLAGLQGVPDELYEAAQLDGASWWQVQRRITIPLLGPTIRTWGFLSIDRFAPAVRHGLDPHQGRTRERHQHHGDLPRQRGHPEQQLRHRRRRLRGPVRDRARHGGALPATHPQP